MIELPSLRKLQSGDIISTNRLYDISRAVQSHVEKNGFSGTANP